MKELRTEIKIKSTPENVWQVLTNFDKYPEWNPLIHHAIGKLKVGEKVDIKIKTETQELIPHCVVIKVEPNKEFCWKYRVFLPALFRGEHSFIIEPMGNGTVRFVDKEIFNGLLVLLQSRDIDTNCKKGFESMDKSLKPRVQLA